MRFHAAKFVQWFRCHGDRSSQTFLFCLHFYDVAGGTPCFCVVLRLIVQGTISLLADRQFVGMNCLCCDCLLSSHDGLGHAQSHASFSMLFCFHCFAMSSGSPAISIHILAQLCFSSGLIWVHAFHSEFDTEGLVHGLPLRETVHRSPCTSMQVDWTYRAPSARSGLPSWPQNTLAASKSDDVLHRKILKPNPIQKKAVFVIEKTLFGIYFDHLKRGVRDTIFLEPIYQ